MGRKLSEWGIVNLDIPKMKTKGGNTNITRKNSNNEKQREKGKIWNDSRMKGVMQPVKHAFTSTEVKNPIRDWEHFLPKGPRISRIRRHGKIQRTTYCGSQLPQKLCEAVLGVVWGDLNLKSTVQRFPYIKFDRLTSNVNDIQFRFFDIFYLRTTAMFGNCCAGTGYGVDRFPVS